ncbi:hypothetical protein Dsin_024911 [Dipteronia sinensis]|uniref:Reverse transcriptase domain-containing protein n=1 Tax=Dipteronia sinensis TaxID=43782 RepID=A0AAD9ZV16_9ROSI|nr:hypothetical protein Dsin_024911 [Dipteronia sinensis]
MNSLNSFILHAKVIDILLNDISFTWSNNREHASWASLDRFLISSWILSWFPKISQSGLPRSVSDHSAIFIGEPREDWGPSPSHFYNDWMEDDLLMNNAKNYLLVKKKDAFLIKDCELRLEIVEKRAVTEGWSEDLREGRIDILWDLWRGIWKEEQMWPQKSRIKWLKKGDKNSKFFHCMANKRRRNNYVGNMVIGGNKILDPIRIKNGIYDFFKNHFKIVPWKRLTILGLDLRVLVEVDREAHERPFNEDEVWAAVNRCDGNKALALDGLNLNFVKANWVSIKDDFMNFIKGFHKDRAIVKDINNTFIALIPKCGTPESLSDFRPISLVNYMYKILAKVLANILKVVMGDIISESQSAIVKNRHILDTSWLRKKSYNRGKGIRKVAYLSSWISRKLMTM